MSAPCRQLTTRTPRPRSELLTRSVFCLVAAGDGWSARFDDAMLHGWWVARCVCNTFSPSVALLHA